MFRLRRLMSTAAGCCAATPSSMRAVVLSGPGGIENLSAQTVDVPPCAPDAVRVRVAACSVCHRDCLDRRGAFPFMNRPTILGHELAGTVVDVGASVTSLAKGDRGG
jgi:acryloyl-coenzyme A reductase